MNLGSDEEIFELPSPNHPLNYPNDLICLWSVSCINGRRISASIATGFNLEDGYDFLSFGDGEQADVETIIAKLTGLSRVKTLTSAGESMWILMSTDRTGTNMGFVVDLRQISEFAGN